MSIRDRLQASLARSKVGETVARATASSRVVAAARMLSSGFHSTGQGDEERPDWVATSIASAAVRSTTRSLAAATTTAAMVRGPHTVGRWGRASALYRWLTAEPAPGVVVIDLRETVTVGPMLAILDRLIASLAPSLRRSSLLERLREARSTVVAAPVRVASVLVLVATVVDLVLTLLFAGFDPGGTALRILVLGVAAVGTRVTLGWNELGETRLGRLVTATLAPPGVDRSERDDAENEPERD